MSEALQKQVEDYGVKIFDQHEIAHLLKTKNNQRIAGVVSIDKRSLTATDYGINVFYCYNLVLAAGGPGALYKTSVYPLGQVGIHGLAFEAGLAAENLTESQFGLASIKFRWNVSGTYMQAIPRFFSTDANGKNERDFLADCFPTMSKLATNIFLKGYQWPFDPQKIEKHQSSLIDILVHNETKNGRRVFMDFLQNPKSGSLEKFDIDALEPQGRDYLKKAGAVQSTPIERLSHMNPPAIDIYKEHGIDLYREPLEIAVCAQHNNGGFAVDKWWQSNIPHTFVIGEMAGTHGVKRPGGSALNAGQVGGLRAAQYIVNHYGLGPEELNFDEVNDQIENLIHTYESYRQTKGLNPKETIDQIQQRMTNAAGHIREPQIAQQALDEATELYKTIDVKGFDVKKPNDLTNAIYARHLSITSVAYLKAIAQYLKLNGGSRGSFLVLDENGTRIHPDVIDPQTKKTLAYKPENEAMRKSIIQIKLDANKRDLFKCESIPVRKINTENEPFETIWRRFREGMFCQ